MCLHQITSLLNSLLQLKKKQKKLHLSIVCSVHFRNVVLALDTYKKKKKKKNGVDNYAFIRAQELCEGRGGRPGSPVTNTGLC